MARMTACRFCSPHSVNMENIHRSEMNFNNKFMNFYSIFISHLLFMTIISCHCHCFGCVGWLLFVQGEFADREDEEMIVIARIRLPSQSH